MIYPINVLGETSMVKDAAQAARVRLAEIRAAAHARAAALVPGGVWTSGLSVVLVALSGQPVGTMTVARANQIIADAQAIWSALLDAESAIEAVLADEALTEAEKVAAIDAVWPAWPETQA
jgi:hypothetical protein